MDAHDIQALLAATPFRPFRISTTRAAGYRIDSPSDVLLTRTTLHIARDRGPDGIAASVISVAVKQIASAAAE